MSDAIELGNLDAQDGDVNISNQFVNRETDTNTRIQKIRFTAISLILIISVTTGLSINLASPRIESRAIDKIMCIENNWNISEALNKNNNYTKCPSQYKIKDGIRISLCNHTQFGMILDIRYFLNDKPSIKGISVSYDLASRMESIFHTLLSSP